MKPEDIDDLDIPAELHTELDPPLVMLGQFQEKLERRERFDRDDVLKLRAMVKAIQDIRQLGRDLGGDYDLIAAAAFAAEVPPLVHGVMELAGIDTAKLHDETLTDGQYIAELVACFSRLEAKAMAGIVGSAEPQAKPPAPDIVLKPMEQETLEVLARDSISYTAKAMGQELRRDEKTARGYLQTLVKHDLAQNTSGHYAINKAGRDFLRTCTRSSA